MRVAVVDVMLAKETSRSVVDLQPVVSVLDKAVAAHHLVTGRRKFPAEWWELGIGGAGGRGRAVTLVD